MLRDVYKRSKSKIITIYLIWKQIKSNLLRAKEMIFYHFRKLATVLLINLQTMFDCFPATLKLFYHIAVMKTISLDFRYTKVWRLKRFFSSYKQSSWLMNAISIEMSRLCWGQTLRQRIPTWEEQRERGSGRYKAVSGPRGVRARALQRLRLTPEDSSAQQPTGTGDSQAGARKMGGGERRVKCPVDTYSFYLDECIWNLWR